MLYSKHVYHNPTHEQCQNMGLEGVPLAFDFDSVLNNLGVGLESYLSSVLGVPVTGYDSTLGYTKFSFKHSWFSEQTIRKIIHSYIEEYSFLVGPNPWVNEFLTWYTNVTRSPVVIVTSRPPHLEYATGRWIFSNLDRSIDMRLVMLHGIPKSQVLEPMGIQAFVDDRYKTCKSLKGVIDWSIVYRQPWNQGRPESAGHLEIDSVLDLIPFVNIGLGRRPMQWPHNLPYPYRGGKQA